MRSYTFYIYLVLVLSVLPFCNCQSQPFRVVPSSTHLFAQKDSVSLYLDVYDPVDVSQTDASDAKGDAGKPVVMFVFGGGFKEGSRRDPGSVMWYRMLNERGYRVIAIDYRLGLKGVKASGLKFIGKAQRAIDMAVEDLFSATVYVLEHAEELGVDPDRIVIAGSSAGAMTVLQAEWEICNGHSIASVLPEGFNYAGVMSFSGAIFSDEGRIRYKEMEPCPHFMCHGTDDHIVTYKKIKFLNLNLAGTSQIVKTFKRNNYSYNVLRFDGNSHEIAGAMARLIDESTDFLETNVTRGIRYQSDALIHDPEIRVPSWARGTTQSLYR